MADRDGVLFLRSTSYDAVSHQLTVRFRSPSGSAWAAYEYRDVAPAVVARLEAAQPHAQHVLDTEIAPFHAVRRVGQTSWDVPRSRDSHVQAPGRAV